MSPLLVGAALGATSAFLFDPQQRRRGEPVTDDVLCARVLSKIGRYTSHSGAIEVTALDGRVVLTGDILEREVHRLVDVARRVRGVQHVDNQLRVHETAEHVSALQGEVFEEAWTPGVRALVGGAGAASLRYAVARGGFGALVALALGAALVARAVKASPRSA